MSKLSDFFKHFKDKYDEEQKRLMRMDKFLDRAEENNDKLRAVATAVDNIGGQVEELKSKVDDLQDHIAHMDGRLAIIGEGTKMELFDTLYNWKKILVDERKWASAAEKREVNDIYSVYHDGLNGNGQGKVYFEQIMALPEEPTSNN
jgi:predicted  nucleic acid-binding Zn-ribbon protein